jgi:UDP-2-acetamido-3-amino-2,3-dideoxy-glucuronate N-acetyltransferase
MIPDQVILEKDIRLGKNIIFDGPDIIVRKGARIDSGAVICNDVEIGQGAWVKAGSVVFSSIPANAICHGNPAVVIGYQDRQTPISDDLLSTVDFTGQSIKEGNRHINLNVGNAKLQLLKKVVDPRGNLTVGEVPSDIPFQPKRYFVISQVPSKELRGEHAHRICHQFLICLSGSCRVLLDDGTNRFQVNLDRPELGLYMPPMIWGTQYSYSSDAILLVFASHHYDSGDYINNYADFINLVNN